MMRETGIIKHSLYGKIYNPIYILNVPYVSQYPNFYNSDGNKMELFFLRDIHTAHRPYSGSKYFEWDRYNIGLNTHFYSHNCMLETMGKPINRYGYLSESEAIVPEDYNIFNKYKGLEKDFDLIFTHSAKLLEKLSNARFVSFPAKPWYGTRGGIINNEAYKYKYKNISFLCSEKVYSALHKYRRSLAHQCKREHLADTFGKFDGGNYVEITEPLTDYRFSIIIENDIQPYYFTEKITSCFAAMTIPVYYGATKIDEFFNSDGIIKFTEKDNILDIIKRCTKDEYETRTLAVIYNFNRVKENYMNPYDYMFEKYLMKRNINKPI